MSPAEPHPLTPNGADLRLFKIFYDATSRAGIEDDFTPLDNSDGPKDWFELWPILRYIETHELEEGVWYGFFSPKFPSKAHITLQAVRALISANPTAEVALFSYNWPTIIGARNAWTQGEAFHPGLISCFEAFLATRGSDFDAKSAIGDFETTVFSNYVVAKKSYWLAWRDLARSYFDYATHGGPALPDNLPTHHNESGSYMVRTFVQERLACWLLLKGRFRVVHPNYTRDVPFGGYFDGDSPWLRRTLAWAHAVKRLARRSNLPGLMAIYWLAMRATGVAYRLSDRRK